ncbi:MAG: MBL fold metallo-hydrolase [Desulfobacterales bacterium]|nr:MBL fold metallo-hydrolase [Desulfobacterales bacterium]
MYIKCWGSRGSIPVSGTEYQKFGGDTTCVEVRSKQNHVIILDAGTGIRKLGNQLLKEGCEEYHIVFTHAHWDHVLGFPFFRAIYQKNCKIYIYRCPFTGQFIERTLSKVMSNPNFPVRFIDVPSQIEYIDACPDAFQIGPITITSIPLNHPNGGRGYKLIEDGKTFVFLTDNELGFKHPGGLDNRDYEQFIADADLVFHDAEYTAEEYDLFKSFGHSSYLDTLALASQAKVKQLGLFHLNAERSDIQMDQIVSHCQQVILDKKYTITCVGVAQHMTFQV